MISLLLAFLLYNLAEAVTFVRQRQYDLNYISVTASCKANSPNYLNVYKSMLVENIQFNASDVF